MSSIEYRARVLPDGHLPMPHDLHLPAGQEVNVTVRPAEPADGEAEARARADYVLSRWAAAGQGSGRGVAEHHDDFLYPE